MASIAEAIAQIQTLVGALDGIRNAPVAPKENTVQVPYAQTSLKSITVAGGPAGLLKWIVTVQTDVLCARQLLPLDVAAAMPYGESYPTAIWADPTLAGTVDTVNAVRGTFGRVQYANQSYIGWVFEVDVKIEKP